ncbi:hypothetical protein [Streptomyces specialis]|uniref:hypothetical protein n=1 Tax=Streptomyces specialis TaxID=498367 RepID=UPI00073FA2AB|nr:hypothetical protein [Streptomyces specialis]
MLEYEEELAQEKSRIAHRPADHAGVPELAFFDVQVTVGEEEYARRMREVLNAALDVAMTASFDEPLPTAGIPEWFACASTWKAENAPDFAVSGRERYLTHPGTSGIWMLSDWLSRFEPEFGMRGWAWWDLTRPAPAHLRIWVDCGTESFFAHLDLLWLAYTCGAAAITPPHLADATEWAAQPTFD